MKSLTLSILPLSVLNISGWEVSERDTWPHKRPRLAEECRRRFHACDARGLASETSISDRFFINAAILFFVWTQEPARTLSPPPPPPPSSSLCRFCGEERKKKTAKVKSPQSTSNRRSSSFLPVAPAALWLLWPDFPSVSFRCRSFYIRYFQNTGLSLM